MTYQVGTTPLRDLLRRAGMNQAELARQFEVSKNTVSNWNKKCPKYAIAYLELKIAYDRLRP